jgi:hypothetical protein
MEPEMELLEVPEPRCATLGVAIPPLILLGVIGWNKTGTLGAGMLYVDNRGIATLRDRGAYRVGLGRPEGIPTAKPARKPDG